MKRKVLPSSFEPHTCRRCTKSFWASGNQKFCKKCVAEMRNEGVVMGACQ